MRRLIPAPFPFDFAVPFPPPAGIFARADHGTRKMRLPALVTAAMAVKNLLTTPSPNVHAAHAIVAVGPTNPPRPVQIPIASSDFVIATRHPTAVSYIELCSTPAL